MKNKRKINDAKLSLREILANKYWIVFICFSIGLIGIAWFIKHINFDFPQTTVLADYINVVVGLPISLSSSLVAIVLGRRAYQISKKQSDSEIKRLSLSSAKEASELYSSMGDEIVRLHGQCKSIEHHLAKRELCNALEDNINDADKAADKVLQTAKKHTLGVHDSILNGIDEGLYIDDEDKAAENFRVILRTIKSNTYKYGWDVSDSRIKTQYAKKLKYIFQHEYEVHDFDSKTQRLTIDLQNTLKRIAELQIKSSQNQTCLKFWRSRNTLATHSWKSLIAAKQDIDSRIPSKQLANISPSELGYLLHALSVKITPNTLTSACYANNPELRKDPHIKQCRKIATRMKRYNRGFHSVQEFIEYEDKSMNSLIRIGRLIGLVSSIKSGKNFKYNIGSIVLAHIIQSIPNQQDIRELEVELEDQALTNDVREFLLSSRFYRITDRFRKDAQFIAHDETRVEKVKNPSVDLLKHYADSFTEMGTRKINYNGVLREWML